MGSVVEALNVQCDVIVYIIGEIQELHEATERTPGIVLVTAEDGGADTTPAVCREDDGPRIKMNALPRDLVQTSRPPFSMSS